tara:strand:+ start:2564 stop:3505 length:942 start_codon:yes stop_codon:yes gene_type:complete
MALGNAIGIGIPMVNLGLGGGGAPVDERFIISVKTDNTGTSNNDQFTLPWIGDYDVDWGDGNTDTGQTGTTTHTYATAGTYDVSVTPTNNCRILFNSGGDRQKLLDVKNWGTGVWTSFTNAFTGCSVMDVTATDTPDLSIATAFNNIFRNCLIMVGNSSFENWNTSNITRPEGMFRAARLFNQNISTWNTSNFIRTDTMFFDARSFNQPIGSWNMSNVTQINNMFKNNQSAFDQSLANWDITAITLAGSMFSSSGLSTANYDATLIGWAAQSITNAVTVDFGNSQYTLGGAAEAARNTLVSTYGWTITDGGGI